MPMTPDEQSRFDKSEIVIRPLQNGWLVKQGPRWWAYHTPQETGAMFARVRGLMEGKDPADVVAAGLAPARVA